MSSAGLQSVTDIVAILQVPASGGEWTIANTDSIAPTVTDSLTIPWGDLKFGASDLLYVKNEMETVKTGLHADDFFHTVLVAIEVMTARVLDPSGSGADSRAHFKKMIDETIRIIKANARLSGYARVMVNTGRVRYVKERGMYIGAIEVELLKVNTS